MRRLVRSLLLAAAVVAGPAVTVPDLAPQAKAGWMSYEPVYHGGQWWTRMYWIEPMAPKVYVGVIQGYWAPW
jgi:asparagine N-glycosylation enzyme membrane subunit Stt3